ncbi:MAG: spermidine synthase [Candidatus Latescibacterota bacterium]
MGSSNIKILAYEPTPLGFLCLRRRALLSDPNTVVTEITLDHEFLMSSENTTSERELAKRALAMREEVDLKVLVGGLGLGYTAQEVLTSKRVACVEVVELLPQVIDWFKDGLFPLAETLKADARLSVREGDIFKLLSRPPDRKFDLILIDVDHAPDEHLADSNSLLYTASGLHSAKAHLGPQGVLAVWSYADSAPFTAALKAVFTEVRVEPVSFQNRLKSETITDWLFFAQG